MELIGRHEIIARARLWADSPRPYSQEDYDPVSGYRLDCSGYVSMAWRLAPPGPTTVDLPDICVRIVREELRPGDAVMLGGPGTDGDAGHVLLFESWADDEHTRLRAFEQVPAGTVYRVRSFPLSPPYLPYRYRMVGERGSPARPRGG
jgi:hypothetical protein